MATKKEIPNEETAVVKRKGNNKKGSPLMGDNGLQVEPGDNAKFMAVNMVLFNMKDIDLYDAAAVTARINEFFMLYARNDMKPTVAGLGLALNGMDRRRLWEIKTGNYQPRSKLEDLPHEVSDSIKKAYKMMENLWETYMNSGKVNPVSGIFLGKNNFGYQDKTEYVLTPNHKAEDEYDVDEIKKHFLIDSGSDENQ